MIYIFDYDLPTLNDYTNDNRKGFKAGSSVKKKATNICMLMSLKSGIKLDNCIYDIEIVWYQKNKRKDPDNIYFGVKFIFDGMVEAKVLPTDGQKNIRNISNKLIIDKAIKNNYCIAYFKEV